MNFIAFLSFAILILIILTLVFGVIAYFLYKMRERKKKFRHEVISYEELKQEDNRDFLYLEEVKIK